MEATIARLTGTIELIVIRTLLYLKALDAIPGKGSVSLADIASATSAQPALLERLLRTVVGTGFLSQTEEGDYSHTPESLTYAHGGGALLEMLYDEVVIPLSVLPEYLDAKRDELGLVEPGGENSFTHNPFTWRLREEGKTPFEIVAKDPERVMRFQRLFGSIAAKLRPFTGVYDFGRLATIDDSERIVLVDVGGGQGHAITQILEVHPNIKPEQCVLQDRKEVIASAREESGLPSGVKCMVHDYYTPQPIKKARAYHFGAVAHDLSDINVVKILNQIRPVMAADSKVLISEQVIPERGTPGLVNLMDMGMLTIGGKERTKKNFQEVLADAGLKIDHVWRAKEGNFGVIEASLE